jgi:ribose 5-phosphate isomerase
LQFTPGVPIEVVPFAYAQVLRKLHNVLGSTNATLRMAKAKAGPVVTDNSNFVIDAPFPRETMMDPSTVRKIMPLPQAYTKLHYCRFWQKSKCSQVLWKLVCSAI